MSRQISFRRLLFYLSVSAILACGLSRRIPREASCPSCSQDCPEALTVQLPWNPRQESNLQSRFLQDSSVNSLQNSLYSRMTRGRIPQNIARDDNIPSSQNLMSFGNYRRFPQQESASRNLFYRNFLNNFPKSLDRREIVFQGEPRRGYPHVVPSRQVFDRSENFFRNPRNKNTEFSLKDYKLTKNYQKDGDSMSKLSIVYRADRDTEPSWKNSRGISSASSNIIRPERFFSKIENYRSRREDMLDNERNAIKKPSHPISQQYDLPRPRETEYNHIGFGSSEIKRDPYVKDTNIPKSTKGSEFFGNLDIVKDSSQSSNLEQLGNNLLEVYPAEKQETLAEDGNEQINYNSYNSKFPQDLNIWKSREDGEMFDTLMRTNTKPFENEEDNDYFMDEEDMKEYFEDEAEKDTIERDNNLYVLPQNTWKEKQNEELFDNLDNSQEFQKMGQFGFDSEEDNKNYFQDEQNEDVIIQDKARTSVEIARAPVINAYNAYILPRYLNIINDKKYPVESGMQELSEVRNNIRSNPVKEMNQRFFGGKAVTQDNVRIQDLILPTNLFDVEEYSNPTGDARNNIRNKNEALILNRTELDPDLVDDVEEPLVGTTEPIPT